MVTHFKIPKKLDTITQFSQEWLKTKNEFQYHKNSSRYLNVLEISYPEISINEPKISFQEILINEPRISYPEILINEPKISYPEILINEPRISYPEILINEPKISYPEISLNPKYPIPRCNWTHISFLLFLLNPRYPYLKILMNLRYSTQRSYWTRDTLPRDHIKPYKTKNMRIHGVKYQPKTAKKKLF